MALKAIHPGEHLAEELEALGMSASELARRLSVRANRVTSILNGQRAVTGDAAFVAERNPIYAALPSAVFSLGNALIERPGKQASLQPSRPVAL